MHSSSLICQKLLLGGGMEEDFLDRVYTAKNRLELETAYDDWAKQYDDDMHHICSWKAPKEAALCLKDYVPIDRSILDAGCGTGIVGEELFALGYKNIVGIDLSNGMLEKARLKNVYTKLTRMDLEKPLEFASELFDAVISVGVLTHGHVSASALDEMIRVTKKLGYIIFTMRLDVYLENGFKEAQDRLEQSKKWKKVWKSPNFTALTDQGEDIQCNTWLYQKL